MGACIHFKKYIKILKLSDLFFSWSQMKRTPTMIISREYYEKMHNYFHRRFHNFIWTRFDSEDELIFVPSHHGCGLKIKTDQISWLITETENVAILLPGQVVKKILEALICTHWPDICLFMGMELSLKIRESLCLIIRLIVSIICWIHQIEIILRDFSSWRIFT